MTDIFLWFYCLDIPQLALLLVLTTVLYLWCRAQFGKSKYWKPILWTMFLCWIMVILYGTLGQRSGSAHRAAPRLIPLYSYYLVLHGANPELCRANFMNAVLFYPAGLTGWELLPKAWKNTKRLLLITGVLMLLSIGVEIAQYRFSLGLAETDDVIHNVIGAFLGALVCGMPMCIPKSIKQ